MTKIAMMETIVKKALMAFLEATINWG